MVASLILDFVCPCSVGTVEDSPDLYLNPWLGYFSRF